MPQPNIADWDAAADDLATAAGAFRASLVRGRLAAGEAAALPAGDGEQLVHVLAGDGLCVQAGGAYAVGAADTLLRPGGAEAYTLVGGDDGLEYLAFAQGSQVPAPAAEPTPPLDGRPTTIVALDDVPPSELHRGRFRAKVRRLGEALGATATGLRHVRIAAGAQNVPHHCHGAEEELFVVLGGAGHVRLGEERFPVERGTVVARPPGTGVAHSFVAGDPGLELLSWGTWEPNDICFYPDSGKVFLCGVGVIGRIEPCDYWDGED